MSDTLDSLADELNAIGDATRDATPDSPEQPLSLIERIEGAILTTAAIRALPPPEWLIDGYLTRNSLALLYGPSGTYKTFLGLDLALHVATGTWWHQNEVARPGRVLYVIAEGVSGIGARLDAWQQHHRLYDLERYAPISWLPRAVNLTDRMEVAAFADIASRIEPDLVVFDTLARCSIGAEENSARDMGILVDHLDAIRRKTGACILSIHHSGKDAASGARGSSALRAGMDTELEMATGDPLVLKVRKQKDAAESAPLNLAPITVAESCVLLPSKQVTQGSEIGAGAGETLAVLTEIAVPGGIAPGAWLKAAQKPERSFYRHVHQLLSRGLIHNLGTDARPRYEPTQTPDDDDPGPDDAI